MNILCFDTYIAFEWNCIQQDMTSIKTKISLQTKVFTAVRINVNKLFHITLKQNITLRKNILMKIRSDRKSTQRTNIASFLYPSIIAYIIIELWPQARHEGNFRRPLISTQKIFQCHPILKVNFYWSVSQILTNSA